MQYDPSNASCGSSTVAYAAPCQYDDVGRPSVGFMNWCSAADIPAGLSTLQSHVEVGVHEVCCLCE